MTFRFSEITSANKTVDITKKKSMDMQIIVFRLNLWKKWLVIPDCKPPAKNVTYFLKLLSFSKNSFLTEATKLLKLKPLKS